MTQSQIQIQIQIDITIKPFNRLIQLYIICRLESIFDSFALAVNPRGEAQRLTGWVGRNPITGQVLPGSWAIIEGLKVSCSVVEGSESAGQDKAVLVTFGPDQFSSRLASRLGLRSTSTWYPEGG